jgi:polysaccharide pyruvyl transferase CsaB
LSDARTKKNKRRGVLICGSYGHGNAGDEAILDAIILSLRRAEPEVPITVLSRSPKETEERHGVRAVYKFNMPAVLRVMLSSRLYINGGGSLIQDVTSRRSLYYYLFTIAAAKLLGCRVIMYGCGIGPVSRPYNRRLARFVIDNFADSITLREDDSLRELRQFGVKKPRMLVASDPALTLSPAPDSETDGCMRALGLDPRGKYLCVVPRKWPGFEDKAPCFAQCADALYEEYGLETVFLSIDHKNDALAAELIARHMASPAHIARDVLPVGQTIGVLARMQCVISMRLHGLIFSAGQGVPLIGVSYDPKVNAFLHYIGQTACIDLSELTSEGLTDAVRRALALWDDGEELSERIRRLRELESVNITEALRLLNE